MVVIVQFSDGRHQQSVVFPRVAIYDGCTMVGA